MATESTQFTGGSFYTHILQKHPTAIFYRNILWLNSIALFEQLTKVNILPYRKSFIQQRREQSSPHRGTSTAPALLIVPLSHCGY